jgi:hypothetical protein
VYHHWRDAVKFGTPTHRSRIAHVNHAGIQGMFLNYSRVPGHEEHAAPFVQAAKSKKSPFAVLRRHKSEKENNGIGTEQRTKN